MAILHTMCTKNWLGGFGTNNNAILTETPYKPEILIIGTYNPDTPENNAIADFFYGRNYFWPAFHNLSNNNPILLLQRRDVGNAPNIEGIFNLCEHFRLSFADLIFSVMQNDNPVYQLEGNTVHFNDNNYNLIDDKDLAALNQVRQVEWNAHNIISYLTITPSIHTVYFTRQPINPYQHYWNAIADHDYGRPLQFKKIFTPAARRLGGNPLIARLLRHWLWNDAAHYDTIDHDWLLGKGVGPDMFL